MILVNVGVPWHIASSNPKNKKSTRGLKTCNNFLIRKWMFKKTCVCVCVCIYIYIYIYKRCPGRNVPDFGRVLLMLKYTDIIQNTYVQSWTVTEIMAREKYRLLAGPHTVPVSWQSYPFPSLSVVSYDGNSAHASQSAMLRHRWALSCIVLGTLRTTLTWVRVFL